MEYTLQELLGMLREVMPHEESCRHKEDMWCHTYARCLECRRTLIDTIERKVAEEVTKAHNDGYEDGYDKGFADWCEEHEDKLEEHGWVKLPVDADGVPIRVGDELTEVELRRRGGKPAEVVCILYNDEGCVVSSSDPSGFFYDPSTLTHKLPPTVEDVLREFALKVAEKECITMRKGVVEEYAKRLRLKED